MQTHKYIYSFLKRIQYIKVHIQDNSVPDTSIWLTHFKLNLGMDKELHHDDVIKWKYFPRYWPFVREIHRSPVNFPHKGQ